MLLGNLSSPNQLTNVLLGNLRQFTGEEQILRIGGLTQYDGRLGISVVYY